MQSETNSDERALETRAEPDPAEPVRGAIRIASQGLVDREVLVELTALAAVAHEHVLVVGPPGTAKSEAVRRIARALGGQYFEYLLGRFTEPSEIFGPVDLRKLRDGVVETQTSGMLPEAEVAFLDEVFRGSSAILNTLLGVLNERVFRRGHTEMRCPLRVCVGATNELPDDETLAAFADRFLVHVFLSPVPDERLEDLLIEGAALGPLPEPVAGMESLDALSSRALKVVLTPVQDDLARAVRMLRLAGIQLTDRRVVRMQRLVAAAAALDGRETAGAADLWPVLYVIPSQQQQGQARDVIREILDDSCNTCTPRAAEDASAGRAARAMRLLEQGHELLQQRPAEPEALPGWRLKLEAVARELDASFDAQSLSEELAELREKIVVKLDQE